MRNRIVAFLLSALIGVSLVASVALAQQVIGHPVVVKPTIPPGTIVRPMPRTTVAPLVMPTLAPLPGAPVMGMPGGYPPLPPRTAANTVTPASLRYKHVFSANGASITVTGAYTQTGCEYALGDNFPAGCQLQWKSSGLPTTGTIGTPKYQDEYMAPGATTFTTIGATYNGPAGGGTRTTTLAQGVTVFAVWDTKNLIWATVVYVTAGNSFEIKVYQDSFYTEESYQFDASNSGNAYIHITNLSASDLYTLSIEQTSVSPNCIFSAPAESPAPAANALCNASNSPGETAAGGSLNITWPILASYSAGTYSLVLYDKTQGQRLGEVQVSLTGSAGNTLSISTDVSSANTTVAPSPAPEGIGGIRSTFAWDDANEQSISGITIGAAAIPSGNYVWSFNDPMGQTASAPANGISGISSYTFQFASTSPVVQTPGLYPARHFSAALYNTATKAVYASQAFHMLAYAAKTTFTLSSDVAALAISPGSSTTATLKLKNNGDVYYGTGSGDPLAGIAFTTGADFLATAGNGNGVEMVLSGHTLAQCAKSAGGCSTTIVDTNGNSWTIRDYCSDVTPNTTSECYLVATPVTTGGSLPVSASISVPSVKFYGATGYACTTACPGLTSVLPYDGVKWSRTDVHEAFSPVYFNSGAASLTATANISLYGAVTPGGTFTTGNPEIHNFTSRFSQAIYEQGSPFVISSNNFLNIYKVHIHNTSTSTITQVAFAVPWAVDSQGYINIYNGVNNDWNYSNPVRCIDANVRIDCLSVNPYYYSGIPAGGSEDIYLELTAPSGSFSYADWTWFSNAPNAFAISADGTTTVPVSSPTLTVDTLAMAAYSLNSNFMGANFSPSTAGTGATTTESFLATNTTTVADPFPDYVDAVILAVPTSVTVSGSPTTSTAGWSYLNSTTTGPVGGYRYYWFGVCASQYVAGDYPRSAATQQGATAPGLPQCTAGQENNSLAPGSTLTTNLTFTGLTTGTLAFYMYAHGANGNGWTTSKEVDLPVTSVSASAGFTKVGKYLAPPAVTTNTVPTIGGNSDATHGNSYVYTIKNTSSATAITQASIVVPGLDINGVNATDSSGNFWKITTVPTLSYSGGATTCTVSSTNATAAGANGAITIAGGSCSIAAGQTMTVTFAAIGPQSQSDQYVWSTTVNSGASTAGENWLGDTRIQVQLSIGLDLVVNPSNPGPGGSVPSISCSGCSFSGSTADFGTVGSSTTALFLDPVRASIYISSATAVTWTLSVVSNINPANSTGTPTKELGTSVDSAHSSSGAGIVFDQTSYAVMPTTGSLQLAHGVSITSRSTPYDILQNFRVSMGNESVTANAAILTYTLVAN